MFELLGFLLGIEIMEKGCFAIIFNFIMAIIKFVLAHIATVMITELSHLSLWWYFLLLLVFINFLEHFLKRLSYLCTTPYEIRTME